MNLFIDIETTSLIPKGADWKTDYNEFPYILSIGMKIENQKALEILIKDCSVEISDDVTRINGITQDQIDKDGIAFTHVFDDYLVELYHVDKVIGHNIFFDSSIIKANVLRCFGPESYEAELIEQALHKDKRIDTMRLAQKKFGGKWMKLEELYFKLFEETFEAHNALQDVIATERIYNELVK